MKNFKLNMVYFYSSNFITVLIWYVRTACVNILLRKQCGLWSDCSFGICPVCDSFSIVYHYQICTELRITFKWLKCPKKFGLSSKLRYPKILGQLEYEVFVCFCILQRVKRCRLFELFKSLSVCLSDDYYQFNLDFSE